MSSAEVELVSSKSKGGDGSDTTKVGDATEKSAREVWPEASVSWLSSQMHRHMSCRMEPHATERTHRERRGQM